MVADVQSWLDDFSTNFGWLLLGNESSTQTSKRFDSRENATGGNRPVLTVEYLPKNEVMVQLKGHYIKNRGLKYGLGFHYSWT